MFNDCVSEQWQLRMFAVDKGEEILLSYFLIVLILPEKNPVKFSNEPLCHLKHFVRNYLKIEGV